jgi:hypothetical protein
VSHTPDPAINDNNPCTQDVCNPQNGMITHPPLATIEDNNACTVDSCNPQNGQVSHTPIDPNDNNACTLDYCDPGSGVHNDPIPGINDNNACTQDLCNPQTGVITHPNNPNVDDNNACTQNNCDPATGQVSHPPNPNINDGNACTQDLCDPANGNVTHPPVPGIEDNNVCTIDDCDTVTGQITHTPDPAIDDDNLCTTDTCHPVTGIANTPAVPCSNQPDFIEDCGIRLCDPATGAAGVDPMTGNCPYKPNAFLEEFANNSQGWTFSAAASPANQWGIGPAMSSAGHTQAGPDPASDGPFGSNDGVAGVAIGGNAINQAHGFYYITSPIIDMSSYPNNNANNDYPLYLNFYRWLNSAVGYQNTVEVYDGTGWVTIAVYNGLQNDTSWNWINLDISSYKNQFFQVRFGYSVSNGAPIVSSWNIDRVRIGRRTDVNCGD